MKYYLLFIFFILFNTTNVWARAETISIDTSINQSNYKHSQKYFLEHYGKDDSTKALINYYFAKRETALIETVIPSITGGVAAFLVAKINANTDPPSGKGSGYAGLVIVPAVIVLLYSVGTLVDGQIKWLVFSRHKLLKTLVDYDAGKPFPKRVTRRKKFRFELKKIKRLNRS